MAGLNLILRKFGAWIDKRSISLDGVGAVKQARQECASHRRAEAGLFEQGSEHCEVCVRADENGPPGVWK